MNYEEDALEELEIEQMEKENAEKSENDLRANDDEKPPETNGFVPVASVFNTTKIEKQKISGQKRKGFEDDSCTQPPSTKKQRIE